MKQTFGLRLKTTRYAVAQLEPTSEFAPLPDWIGGDFFSVTRTPNEISVICAEDSVPDGLRSQGGWRCLEVVGPFDFDHVGVLSALSDTLARAGVSLLALATYETDYLLVQQSRLATALAALRAAGHRIAE